MIVEWFVSSFWLTNKAERTITPPMMIISIEMKRSSSKPWIIRRSAFGSRINLIWNNKCRRDTGKKIISVWIQNQPNSEQHLHIVQWKIVSAFGSRTSLVWNNKCTMKERYRFTKRCSAFGSNINLIWNNKCTMKEKYRFTKRGSAFGSRFSLIWNNKCRSDKGKKR